MNKHLQLCRFLILLCGAFCSLAAWAQVKVDIRIEGIKGALYDNAMSFLSLEQQKESPQLTEERLKRLHQKAPGEIREALEPFGYYEPTITSDLVQREKSWLASYKIDTGPPTLVESVDVRILGAGADDDAFKAIVKNFPLKPGDTLNHSAYEQGKNALQRVAAERGYLNALLLDHELVVNREKRVATVVLHYDTGPRYFFGSVIFHQDAMNPDFIQKFVPFEQGSSYSTDKLFDLQNALTDSDYFANVEVQARRDLADNLEVPIDVRLDPKKRNRYTAGFGYGTDTGARSSLGWNNRRVNRRGHRFRSALRLSEISNNFSAAYIVPIRNPRTDQFEFKTSWTEEISISGQNETTIFGISRSISHRPGWLQTIYLNYQMDSFIIGEQSGKSRLLLPGINWTRIKADDRIYTLNGQRLSLDIRGTDPRLGSDAHFLQIVAWAKFIRKATTNSRVLLRIESGMTSFGELQDLPPSLRFFAGGDQSVRGYKYRSLSPRDENDEPIGGEQMFVSSLEYEYRFTPTWSGAVFYDAGNASVSWQDFSLQKSAGFGVRWKTPIGLIRLDIAQALSPSNDKQSFHLVIGPDL